jgi:hypothetical protein
VADDAGERENGTGELRGQVFRQRRIRLRRRRFESCERSVLLPTLRWRLCGHEAIPLVEMKSITDTRGSNSFKADYRSRKRFRLSLWAKRKPMVYKVWTKLSIAPQKTGCTNVRIRESLNLHGGSRKFESCCSIVSTIRFAFNLRSSVFNLQ